MKALLIVLAAVGIVIFLNQENAKKPVLDALATANTEVAKTIAAPSINAIENIGRHAEETYAQRKVEEKNAEKVKVYIPARDTKTCMKILKTDVINNQVIECNKDRTVEVRRDEVDNFKKEQEL